MILVKLEEAAKLLTLCLMTASLSVFLDKCMEANMILWRYRLYLTALWMKSWRKKDRWKRYALKPLGLCIYCFGTWVFIVQFLCLLDKSTGFYLSLLYLSNGVGFNYLFIKLYEKHLQ